MLLYEWFENFISQIFKKDLSGTPYEILEKLKAPLQNYYWLQQIENTKITLKQYKNTIIPNLELKQKNKLRQTGTFFTPEFIIHKILDENLFNNKNKYIKISKVLDPACGDGAWLATYLNFHLQKIKEKIPLIYGYDTNPTCLLVCLAKILFEYSQNNVRNFFWPKLILGDFLQHCKSYQNYFDLVLGNPPYKVNLPESYKKFLEENFSTTEGEKDLYTFFIEGAIKVLKESGKLIFLTSHTYLVNHQCSKLRKFIFCENKAEKIYILNYRFFENASAVLPVILILKKQNPTNSTKSKIFYYYSRTSNNFQKSSTIQAIKLATPTNLRKALISNKLKKILNQIEKNAAFKISDIAKVGVGIQESNYTSGIKSKYVSPEAKSLEYLPVVKCREIKPFIIEWEGKYIFYGSHLAYKGNIDLLQQPKILYQNIRNESLPIRLVAALDLDKFIPKNSVSFITLVKYPFTLKFLVGILNSTLINAWFAANFFSFHITVSQVKQIPLFQPTSRQIENIDELVEKIIQSKITNNSENYNIFINQLDKEVLKVYNITSNLDYTLQEFKNLLEELAKMC